MMLCWPEAIFAGKSQLVTTDRLNDALDEMSMESVPAETQGRLPVLDRGPGSEGNAPREHQAEML